jgi:3-methyladenine DNA glycosylase Tag
MKKFELIYEQAVIRKGGEKVVANLLPIMNSSEQIALMSDDRFLSAMTNAVFKAGFYWKVIEAKWQGFEEAFWNFNIMRCMYMSPDDYENLYSDPRIIRNTQKIDTVALNAMMIHEFAEQYGSFANMIAEWSDDDFVGLLALLQKQGSRLGSQTTQFFLRKMGKDGFVLMRDGVAALINAEVIDKALTSKKAMQQVQNAFNQWRRETGFTNAQISKILALSIEG